MSISALERWYASQCNGDWEHGYGVTIETLDNPGWSVRIDLRGTKNENSALQRTKIERTEENWIHYWAEKKQFHIACGALNLSEGIELFVQWFNTTEPQ